MKVLILGATGRTGKWLVSSALERSYEVNCLVRPESRSKIEEEPVNIVEGTPLDRDALAEASAGCDALVSALNVSRKSDFPWAKMRTPEDFLSEVMKNIIAIAADSGPRRVVICTAWGVGETFEDLPRWFAWFIRNSNIGITYADHERQEKLLRQSDLDWTVVRPSGLTNSKKDRKIRESYSNKPRPSLMISRKSVAQFMIEAIERRDLSGKSPVISN